MTLNEAQRDNSFKGLKEAQRPLKETMLKDHSKTGSKRDSKRSAQRASKRRPLERFNEKFLR